MASLKRCGDNFSERKILKRKSLKFVELLVTIAILAVIFSLILYAIKKRNANYYRLTHRGALQLLHKAMQQYAADCDGQYPVADKWCDLLIEHQNVPIECFLCPSTKVPTRYSTTDPNDKSDFPVDIVLLREYDEQKQHYYYYAIRWSHNAINPNARPDSSGDVVLLFETKGGWNQFGGPEILTDENHLLEGHKGCHILFNNGRVKFVESAELVKLNWGDEQEK